jgi:aminomuconate-semialdehyde/2-hydroxymuconate-6-semialdehyde dehydrogenase
LPAGVLNIVQGSGPTAGQAIVEHSDIKAVSFTGGTATGRQIAAIGAPMFKKLSLELGGKNPNIVFADCDYDKMLATTMRSSFYNQGQLCLCGSRIFVQQTIYDRFKSDLVERTKKLVVGHPEAVTSNIGALISKSHLHKVKSYIDLIDQEEATLLAGGDLATVAGYEDGYYFQPTVIEVKSNSCRLNQEEIFGPVVTLMPFETEEEALALANDVPYGLSATVWTQDISRAMRVSEKIEAGVVWVNSWLLRDLRTPFGGMKQSGVGREGGLEALRFFTEPKNVCIQY